MEGVILILNQECLDKGDNIGRHQSVTTGNKGQSDREFQFPLNNNMIMMLFWFLLMKKEC